ncbi:MAG: D-aminoacylase, partial [Firmicutes bacterium]|nr:D-aminoacylase [Bacillota bacterium]
DGTGGPWYRADVGVLGGRIACVGNLKDVAAVVDVDAAGKVVAPGFVDTHSHCDLVILSDPQATFKLAQGITTEVIGQDGLGVAPVAPEARETWRDMVSGLTGDPAVAWTWSSLGQFLEEVERAKPATNVACLAGYGPLRVSVAGFGKGNLADDALERVQSLFTASLEEGACGLSWGMVYFPCFYSCDEEMVALGRMMASKGLPMVIHLWSESRRLMESLQRAVGIARSAGIPLHVSHLKCAGKTTWGKAADALEILQRARESGVEVTFDQYPYTEGSTTALAMLPPWVLEGGADKAMERLSDERMAEMVKRDIAADGWAFSESAWENDIALTGWDGLTIAWVKSDRNKWCEGKTLTEIGAALDLDPCDAFIGLLVEERGAVTVIEALMNEDDVVTLMRSGLHMLATDGIPAGKPHPRLAGSFPRFIGRYSLRRGVVRLEEAIRHVTSAPAARVGLWDRGLIRPGMAADIVVFEESQFLDRNTFDDPTAAPSGLKLVLVNGAVALADGRCTGIRNGKVLRPR